ncbi:E3 ubiquitin-protein ligase TRIM7-like [Eublepharis macularius]|uniref:E3 ubiquitin-protein ligase TRIM7-like n=1 Tax=Eublepharis macularius TaxID=481883 RepID=A0AA97J6C3_EUBMA|nr:E3 ubiquitin-protein ligase TRIM7-like [Eublepharis macularius]
MAVGGPVSDLCLEATCSICLEYFKDPLMIAECGHNFCRACLPQSWGESGAEASCPLCRGPAQPRNLRPNLQLANFVEIAKKFAVQEEKEADVEGAEGKEGVCEKHQEPLELFCKDDDASICVVCCRTKEHKDHQVIPLEEASGKEKTIIAAGKVCEKHQKPLKLFCKDDDALICVSCDRSKEHKYHEVVPLEEAAQEYKNDICSFLEVLKKERTKFLEFKSDVIKESQVLLKQTKAAKQKTIAEFRQLHQFLEVQEKHLLAQMGEMEKEITGERDKHMARVCKELSSLESLIQEAEEKIQQPANELLQDVRSTLQRFEGKEKFETPVAFPPIQKWKIWDLWDISSFLEGVMKQFRVTLVSGLQLQKANVTLNPKTAHPRLFLSEDQKSVRQGEKPQALPSNPERFEYWDIVLGCEGFTTGRYFWEIIVGHEKVWFVGVTKKSVKRKSWMNVGPVEGIWALGKNSDNSYTALSHPHFTVNEELKKIRVVLNCEGRQVAFFDANTAALLHTYSGASFSGERLHPFFWVCEKGHLRLPP